MSAEERSPYARPSYISLQKDSQRQDFPDDQAAVARASAKISPTARRRKADK
jgi:hypothetical protein